MGVDVVLLADGQRRHQHAHERHGGHDGEGHADGGDAAHHRHERAPNHRRHVRDGRAGHPSEGDGGGDGELLLGVVAEFGDERVVRRAVEREGDVVADHGDEQERRVHPAGAVDRAPEHEHGDHRERQGGEFQERHTASRFGIATVGEGRHGRVHERVEESGEGGDAAHHGHDAENDQALRHEYGLTLGDGLLVRLVEIHEPVGDDAGKQRPPELADRKRPHFGDGEIFDG